ncbi:MAG: hypothetical protein F2534_22900, partial [Actinobacteria bacterium]|nr:hypothetical protein [Actinomycetota bacterium]
MSRPSLLAAVTVSTVVVTVSGLVTLSAARATAPAVAPVRLPAGSVTNTGGTPSVAPPATPATAASDPAN